LYIGLTNSGTVAYNEHCITPGCLQESIIRLDQLSDWCLDCRNDLRSYGSK